MVTELIAILALIASAINVILYGVLQKKCNAIAQMQTLIGQGALETQVRSEIANTASEVRRWAAELSKNPKDGTLKKIYASAAEAYRNAYEDACAKYIDGKIDTKRFEKMYKTEIYNLVNSDAQKDFYASNQTTYVSTTKVYKQWFAQE